MEREAEVPEATSSDDTATLADAPGALARGSQSDLGETLGRYRIERVLGEGGMGVVYLAFDPDLERHVALKVLRAERVADDARARLLREARALARLAHPNVVAVHEVGSEGKRDFVAMELVEGQTVASWLAVRPRAHAEILDVFCAAGRGLAAAHAAGLVHRDFKPQNMLRANDGRVVVTDFGLARGADGTRAPTDPPLRPSLVELTATGQVIGTPAYMAPEQWRDAGIGPAADQFAFCISLWEALAGERPFHGADVVALRAAVTRGSAELDAARLPRWIRSLLVRGLAAAPANRWPDMTTLVAQLARRRRRPLLLGLAGAGMACGAALAFGIAGDRGAAPAASTCSLARVPAPIALASQPAIERLLARTAAALHTTALRTCGLAEAARRPALDCLDHVVPRIDAAARAAAATTSPLAPEAVATWLVDPALCLRPVPPHLTLVDSDEIASALAMALRSSGKHDPASAANAFTLAERASDPCARAIGAVAGIAIDYAPARATSATLVADRCADDALRAVLALQIAHAVLERGGVDDETEGMLAVVANTVARVPQDLLVASEWVIQAAVHEQRDRVPEALALVGRAIDRFAAHDFTASQADAESLRLRLYLRRANVEDIRAMRREIALWRPRLQHDPSIVADLDKGDAFARLLLGDVEGARAALLRVWNATPREHGPQRIAGRVVDAAGRPVAGATIFASALLVSAGSGILPGAPADVLAATSDADGRFAIAGGPRTGAVLAIAGTLRSPPAAPGEHLRLVVNSTRTITGRIELGPVPHTKVVAVATSASLPATYNVIAPVAPDGTFAIAGAPVEAAKVAAVIGFGRASTAVAAELELPASSAAQRDIALSLASGDRTVYVIVRSTLTAPLTAAIAALERGARPHEGTFADALHRGMPARKDFAAVPRDAPPDVLARTRPGDLLATFEHAPDELLSACAMALPPDWQRYERYAPAFELRCVPLPREARIVVVETPPQRRFD